MSDEKKRELERLAQQGSPEAIAALSRVEERVSGEPEKKVNWVDKKAENNCWITPPEVIEPVHKFFPQGFLDPATEQNNPSRAKLFFTKETNGLVQDWHQVCQRDGLGVFVNPPYSLTATEKEAKEEPPIRAWTAKIAQEAGKGGEGLQILALLPCGARFSTKYFQNNVFHESLYTILFFRGRVKFIDGRTGKVGKCNNYDSMLLGYNVDADRFYKCFGHLGTCFETVKLPK
jgi:phage N-6-adenine-methyltransferase